MAAFSGRVAVASVGVSCQGAYQIRRHGELIGRLTGGTTVERTTVFDWMICPASSVAALIAEGRYYPHQIGELAERVMPYWPDHNCWYWHYAAQVKEGEPFMALFAHLSSSFEAITDAERQVFILANSQNNLTWVDEVVGGDLDYHLRDADVDGLRSALLGRFPRAELYVVSYPHRHSITSAVNAAALFELPLDDTEWKGDDDNWTPIFEAILKRDAPTGA